MADYPKTAADRDRTTPDDDTVDEVSKDDEHPLRGGSAIEASAQLRSAFRNPNGVRAAFVVIGFRVVRALP